MMRSFSLVISCLSIGVLGSACGGAESQGFDPVPESELPGAAAGVLCDLLFGCECENPGYADEPSCVDAQAMNWEMEQAAAQTAGLAYDEQCAGNSVGAVQKQGCSPILGDGDCKNLCAVYHGTVPVDGACTQPVPSQPFWSDCAQGSWCAGGTCQSFCGDSPDYLGNGQMCRSPEGESLGQCDPEQDLFCDPDSGSCVQLPGPGEACLGGIDSEGVCGRDAYCDFEAPGGPTCQARPGEGQPCEGQAGCADGLFCDYSNEASPTCQAPPGEGQPCPNGQCDEGLFCNGQQMCESQPPAVCGGGGGSGTGDGGG
jgi:hypothetical protein